MINLLKKAPIFARLSDDDLKKLEKDGVVGHYDKGESVVKHGEEGDSMFLIIKGQVKLTLFNRDGKSIVLSSLNEGDFFGEFSLLDEKSRSCTVIASTDCDLFIMTRRLFFKLIREHPILTFDIIKEMTKRLRKADDKIASLALLDVYGRMVQILYEIGNDVGRITDEGIVIDKMPTHEELASLAGATRETVSRVISSIKKTGQLKYYKDRKAILRQGYRAHS